MSFEVPEHVRPLRQRVRQFIEERIYPGNLHASPEWRVRYLRPLREYRKGNTWDFGIR